MNKIKNNKFLLSLLCLIVIILILLIFRITYAFLASQIGDNKKANVNLNLDEVYSLKFIPGSNLDLTVTAMTLPEEGNDLTVTSNPSVQLFEPNIGKEHSYYVYLSIPTNPFVYTEEGTPEILLTVKKGNEEIKKISDLSYDTELGGFDITNFSGMLPIGESYTISSSDQKEVTHNWTITLTYRNLNRDQSINLDKTLNVQIIMQEEKIPKSLADVCSREEKIGDCIKKLETTADYKINNIVYHNAQNATEKEIPNSNKVAGDDSYRFVGANPNNYVCFGSACSNEASNPNYKNLYRIIGLFKNKSDQYEMKIIKADAATAEDLGNKENVDGGAYYGNYTYDKTNYKGKLTTFASYYWNSTDSAHLTYNDSTNTNMWKDSNLNTKNLNEKYYNAIEETYKAMVVEHEWQVGGTSNTGDAKSVYDSELGGNKLTSTSKNCYTQDDSIVKDQTPRECNLANDLTYSGANAHVGLMYISDYMYATLPEYWTNNAYNYQNEEVKTNNWMYMGLFEWTLSRPSANGYDVRSVSDAGRADYNYNVCQKYGVRPVLYLSSNVKITGGSGTETDPFQLEA